MQQYRLLDLARPPPRPGEDRSCATKRVAVRQSGRIICVLACLILSACATTTEVGPYPSLQPLDSLLAQADMVSTDPGPAQVQRANQLQSRMRTLAP